MRPTISQYGEALEELTAQASASEVDALTRQFFAFLKHRGEEKKMAAIVEHLEKSEAEKSNRLAVVVTTAHAPMTETKAALSRQAAQLFPHKTIELSYEVNPALIGGALFRTDEVLYDATLDNEVRALKNSLLKA
jgi:F0F1-type ATP synthase delta subunit